MGKYVCGISLSKLSMFSGLFELRFCARMEISSTYNMELWAKVLVTIKVLGHKRNQLMVLVDVWDVMFVNVSQIVIVEESMWVTIVDLL